MATPLNSKCPKFICPFSHPRAVAVDFMAANLNRWNRIYLFPPVKLLSRVLWKLETYQGKGVIVCPRLAQHEMLGILLYVHLVIELKVF